jgi:DNA-binding NtrC family response regulator
MAVGQVFTAERPISATVLIVDDEDATRSLRHEVATDSGLRTRTASTTEQALEILDQMPVDILITGLRVPQIGGLELLKRVRSNYPQTAVLVLTQYGTIESAVEATRLGAADYITKLFHIPELRSKLDRMIRLLDVDQENRVLRETLRTRPGFADSIGVSLKMQRVYRLIERVSQHAYPVLILGESGTGKELVARSVHFSGVRRNKPFIPVDCSSLVPTLIEVELFGYVKGAFTGALHAKQGLMEIADDGTLFLDEIGDPPFDMQAKLLRALQEKELRPVGSTDRIPLSARIIAVSRMPVIPFATSSGNNTFFDQAGSALIPARCVCMSHKPGMRNFPRASSCNSSLCAGCFGSAELPIHSITPPETGTVMPFCGGPCGLTMVT